MTQINEQNAFKKGDKVIAINKTSRSRKPVDATASYHMRIELEQDYLFINAIDEEASKAEGETCYWCGARLGNYGDSFRESDLIPYIEE